MFTIGLQTQYKFGKTTNWRLATGILGFLLIFDLNGIDFIDGKGDLEETNSFFFEETTRKGKGKFQFPTREIILSCYFPSKNCREILISFAGIVLVLGALIEQRIIT